MRQVTHTTLLILLANQSFTSRSPGLCCPEDDSTNIQQLVDASGVHWGWFKDYIQYMQVHKVIDRRWAVAFTLPCLITQLLLSLALLSPLSPALPSWFTFYPSHSWSSRFSWQLLLRLLDPLSWPAFNCTRTLSNSHANILPPFLELTLVPTDCVSQIWSHSGLLHY